MNAKSPTDKRQIMMARQPILTSKNQVYGYELLYRGIELPDQAQGSARTARVLAEAIVNWGVERVVGSSYMFVNFDQNLLESDLPTVLPAGQGVAEILETVEPTPKVLDMLGKWRKEGVCLALDDFDFSERSVPFLDHVDYVKVDVLAAGDSLEDIVARLKPYKVSLIAEKVETRDQVVRCAGLGFRLFQGFFFARPELLKSDPINASQLAIVSLIGELQKPNAEAKQLSDAISRDVLLSHQILRLANSAAFRRQRTVSSISDAVVILGQDLIRQWASLLLVGRLGPDKPQELTSIALVRGRLCQALGASKAGLEAGELFTVGLLSVLDALLDRPMETLVSELPLSMKLREALCGSRMSALGDVLQQALGYEQGDWSLMARMTEVEQKRVVAAYQSAIFVAETQLAA